MSAIILFVLFSLPTQAQQSNTIAQAANTQLELPSIFTAGAVLQRDVVLPVWGTATSGDSVAVSFNGITQKTLVDIDGNWRVDFQPMAAGGPYTMDIVSGTDTTNLSDMYVGDVWFASGQSNMEWTISQLPVAADVIAAANDLEIRQFRVSNSLNSEPTSTVPTNSSWTPATSSFVGNFSAVGYFFANHLRPNVNVPIGIINATYGGSRIETWMSEDMLGYDEQDVILGDGADHRQPTMAYNAMIQPLLSFPVKGFLWYQGESNNTTLEDVTAYGAQFQTLIQGWRTSWGQGDLPFIWVQLPNFGSVPGATPSQSHLWPKFRASQDSALVLPNTGQAITIDVGSSTDIHPPDKEPVGYRLSLIARKLAYGEDIVYSGPVHESNVMSEDGRVIISYDHAGSGLVADPAGVPGSFTIEGDDGTYIRAEAAIEGDNIVVWHNDVPNPVLIRYAWENNPIDPNLYNSEGLPAAPFEAAVSPPPTQLLTLALGDLNLGVAAHDPRAGDGYIMYSEESVHTRFEATPPSAWAADHLIAVVFDGGEWKIDRNKNTLVPFSIRSSDRLLVEVDFGENTVSSLEGLNTIINGISAGYESGDLVITPETWGGNPDNGEFWAEGTEVVIDAMGLNSSPMIAAIDDQSNYIEESVSLTLSATDSDGDAVVFTVTGLPAGLSLSGNTISGTLSEAGIFSVGVTATDGNGGVDNTSFAWTVDGGDPTATINIALGDLRNGIAAHDQRTGGGYIMYSEESVHTRFADNPPSAWQADHLIAVVFDGGEWKVDRNKYTLVPFTPLASDHLVASVDFGADVVTHLVGVNTAVEGINAGYVSGDLVITAEMWAGSPNEGEFGLEGTTLEIPGEVQQAIARGDDPAILAGPDEALPEAYDLSTIYPNPFSGTTTIEYQLPEAGHARMEIYNATGQLVNVLIDGEQPQGYLNVHWKGDDNRGIPVASGVYLVRYEAGGSIQTKKIVVIR